MIDWRQNGDMLTQLWHCVQGKRIPTAAELRYDPEGYCHVKVEEELYVDEEAKLEFIFQGR